MKILVIGAGGQARVVSEILRHDQNIEIVAFVNNVVPKTKEKIMGIPVVGDHSILPALIKKERKDSSLQLVIMTLGHIILTPY